MTNHINLPFFNKRDFKINWTISINDQSIDQRRRLSPKSNIVKKNGFLKYETIKWIERKGKFLD